MIQRIQSLWLLLASLAILSLFVFPTVSAANFQINAMGLYISTNLGVSNLQVNYFIVISTAVLALISFVNIFNFKNRTLQKRIIFLNIILIIALSAFNSQEAKKIPGGIENAQLGVGMFLPMIAILFSVLALKGIKNDEKLIQSADRLR